MPTPPAHAHPRLRLMIGLALFVGAMPGCARSAPLPTPAPAAKAVTPAARPTAQAAIATVSERAGEILAEVPLGSGDGVEPGTLLRVYRDIADGRTLKGMIQITEVLGEHRAIGRQIGLSDRGAPLAAGDVARVADLAATLTDYQGDLAAGTKERTASEHADDARFAKLRENYQRELALAQARLDQQLAGAQSAHDQSLIDLTARQQRELEAKDLERKGDLAALRATMSAEANAAVLNDREERGAKLQATTAENRRLSTEVDRLAGELSRCQLALTTAQKDLATRDESYRAAVRAEVETRQALQVRVADLERRLCGATGTSPVAVLSNDPKQGETVLERLTRLSNELAGVRDENARLGRELAAKGDALATGAATAVTLSERSARLEAAELRAAELATQLAQAQAATAAVKAEVAASELTRLEAERSLYELAGRVLKLNGAAAEVAALQDRLRQLLAVISAPAGATP